MAFKKGDTYTVSTKKDPLHLRKTPNGTVITHIPKGAKVKIANASKCSSTWLYVTYNSKTGYAYKKYLTGTETKPKNTGKGKGTVLNTGTTGGNINGGLKPTVITDKGKTDKNYVKSSKGKIASSQDINKILNYKAQMKSSGLYDRNQLASLRYTKYFRYGHIDPYFNIANTREYLFFTRPNLHIQNLSMTRLNTQIENYPYFQEMFNRYKAVLDQLQIPKNQWGNSLSPLLSYHVTSTLDLPSVSSKTVDGPQNIFGISVNYRGDGRQSDYGHEFSLQFTDDKLLTCYRYFKTWEEYQRLKNDGMISPPWKDSKNKYWFQANKILHDQIGIYKIIVGEDGREIIYYAYAYGCFPKSVPRDSFSELKDNPTYNIDWYSHRIIDMDPRILSNFNTVSGIGSVSPSGFNKFSFLNEQQAESAAKALHNVPGQKDPDDDQIARRSLAYMGYQSDMQPVSYPFIHRCKNPNHPSGYSYQLLWYAPPKTYPKESTRIVFKEGETIASNLVTNSNDVKI